VGGSAGDSGGEVGAPEQQVDVYAFIETRSWNPLSYSQKIDDVHPQVLKQVLRPIRPE